MALKEYEWEMGAVYLLREESYLLQVESGCQYHRIWQL